MSELIYQTLMMIIYAFAGGYFIKYSIDFYHEKKYFLVGLGIMTTFYTMLQLTRIVFVRL